MKAANKREETTNVDARGRRPDAAQRARNLAKAHAMPAVAPIDAPHLERVVDAELADPSPHGGILEVFQQRYLLKLMVTRMLAAMYAASLLGLMWSYIQPAMRFLIYYTLMGIVLSLHNGYPSYAVHLFCGIVFVHYFSETWSGGTRSIFQNRALVLKMRLPREVFPVAAMLVAAYHTLPQVVLLAVVCFLTGWHITLGGVIAGILGMAILIAFGTATALVFSALNVFYRDFQNVVGTLLQFLHFMVPMMYPFSRIFTLSGSHPWLYQAYMANPVAEAVVLMQRFFWWDVVPAADKHGYTLHVPGNKPTVEFPPDLWVRGFAMLAISVILLWLAQRFFTRVEDKFPERL